MAVTKPCIVALSFVASKMLLKAGALIIPDMTPWSYPKSRKPHVAMVDTISDSGRPVRPMKRGEPMIVVDQRMVGEMRTIKRVLQLARKSRDFEAGWVSVSKQSKLEERRQLRNQVKPIGREAAPGKDSAMAEGEETLKGTRAHKFQRGVCPTYVQRVDGQALPPRMTKSYLVPSIVTALLGCSLRSSCFLVMEMLVDRHSQHASGTSQW